MKKVLILYGKSNWKKSKPFENEKYQYSYEYFYELCRKNGIQMYRASYQWYDYEKNLFKYGWLFKNKKAGWIKVKDLRPDLIYDKTKSRLEVYYKKELINKVYPFINDLQFTQIVDDKFLTGIIFGKWSKRSWLADKTSDLKLILPKIKSKKVVIKPISDSGGNGIFILDKKKALTAQLEKRCVVQEFIDSSKGVPGVSKKTHDLRLVFANNKLVYSYIREPLEGSYLANLAQGGSLHIVPKEKLPKSLFPIIEYSNKIFEPFYPRVMTIDFMFDGKKRPWVVELNSMPGLYFSQEEKPYMIEMYEELLKIFKKKLAL